jgi:hypothetical protein
MEILSFTLAMTKVYTTTKPLQCLKNQWPFCIIYDTGSAITFIKWCDIFTVNFHESDCSEYILIEEPSLHGNELKVFICSH